MTPSPHLWPSARRQPTLFTVAPSSAPRRPVFAAAALTRARRHKARPRVVEVSPELLPRLPVKQGVLMGFEDIMTPVDEGDVYLRQMALRDVPPAAKRRYKVLSLDLTAARDWIAERFTSGRVDTQEARRLVFKLKGMRVRDALHCGDYHLELVWLKRGLPHFRLFYQTYLMGIVDIPTQRDDSFLVGVDSAQDDDRHEVMDTAALSRIQRALADYLTVCGVTADASTVVIGDARTRQTASKRDLYHLFKVKG